MTHSQPAKTSRLLHAIAISIIGALAVFSLSPALCASEEEVYTIVLPSPVIDVGTPQTVNVLIKPKPGWKWNLEYPSRAAFSSEGPIQLRPEKLSKANGKIEANEKLADFPLTLEGSKPGEAVVVMKANFSICNEAICQTFRNKEFRFTVKVQ